MQANSPEIAARVLDPNECGDGLLLAAGNSVRRVGPELIAATKLIAGQYQGKRGRFAHQAFEWINRELFGDVLPWPLIVWTVTPYGKCLGFTDHYDALPFIALQTGLLRRSGPAFVLDVLIHESIHVAVAYLRGGNSGETSHNSPEWIAEVNRIAPLIGLGDFVAGANKVKRVATEELTKTGKQRTRPMRMSQATWRGQSVPFSHVASFPHPVRELIRSGYYCSAQLPFCSVLEPGQDELLRVASNTAGTVVAAHNDVREVS